MPADLGEEKEKKKKLTAEQKWGAVILVFFGVAVLGFGLWQFLYRVRSPFFGRATGLKNFKSLDQQEFEKLLAKQNKDTDSDGLTDFDEEYVYKTSPYLEDSDSDGFSDKTEIESNNDPNCPSGKTCGLPAESAGGSETGAVVGSEAGGAANAADAAQLSQMQSLLSGEATPEAIRKILKESGVSEEALSKIEDKDLLDLYKESLKETNASNSLQNLNLNVNAPPSAVGATGANVNAAVPATGLTPVQVRELFRQAGVDEATLSAVDDATLMKIYEESMKE